MKYRPEIDGLRAVAVVPVILFHAGLEVFSGGFIGVDVFFVISGFLITGILISELDRDNFSILRFYERRARRILPALLFVMACSLPFALMWMLPSELKAFSLSLVAVCLFMSNILFWRESGYFASAAELKPLLHTWSLAVEEQYYLLFPILLIVIWGLGKRRVFWTIVAITVSSFLLSEWASSHKPTANFYLAPTRAWELLIGSICAFLSSRSKTRSNTWLSAAGLLMIVFGLFTYNQATPFPGRFALLPVCGTALILLFCNTKSWVGRLLSMKGFVGIGLISYSAYLWHQPLFAFARIRSFSEPSEWLMLSLAVASLGVAYLSWKFVEQPFRRRPIPLLPNRRSLFGASALILLLFAILGTMGSLHGNRLAPKPGGVNMVAIQMRLKPNFGLHEECETRFTVSEKCQTAGSPRMLLWGDSFAMHLAQALQTSDSRLAFRQHTISACSPILGISFTTRDYGREWAERCIDFNDQVLQWLEANETVEYVVISSPFAVLFHDILDRNGNMVPKGENLDYVASALMNTIDTVRSTGRKVTLVSRSPGTAFIPDLGRCLLYSRYLGKPFDQCDFSVRDFDQETQEAYELMRKVEAHVPVIWLDDYICSDEACDIAKGDVLIYRDNGHLSREGSAYLGEAFDLAGKVRKIAE